jgi:hypothetical protein
MASTTTCTTTDDSADAATFIALGLWAALAVATLVAVWFVLRRAGYSGWLVLLGLIPGVNVVFYFIFAFKKWPVIKELEWRRTLPTYPAPGYPGGPYAGGPYSGPFPAGPFSGGPYPPSGY